LRLLSDASEYALRAIVWLGQEPGRSWRVREIAEHTHAAPGYLVKVLQQLARAGLLSAQRGSNGGYTMTRPPGEVTIADVLNAVDPIERIETCPLGLEAHGKQLCPLHRRIDDAMALIERTFASITVADLIREASQARSECDCLTTVTIKARTASVNGSSQTDSR